MSEESERKEREKKYLESDGTECPFCGSTEISGGDIEADGSVAWSDVRCRNPKCGKEWQDVYNLVGISEYGPDGHLK